MGGTALKVAIGGFLVWLSTQMGVFAEEILGRVRESVQASELLSVDGAILSWAMTDPENAKQRAPRNQAEFERVLRENLSAGGGRDVTKDRWEETYLYEKTPRADPRDIFYRITSKGPDKKLGTPDDLVVERTGETVRINRDPVKIAEAAIAQKKEFDRQVAARVRTLLDQAKDLPPEKGSSGQDGSGSGSSKPTGKSASDVSPDALAREVQGELRFLGSLVPASS